VCARGCVRARGCMCGCVCVCVGVDVYVCVLLRLSQIIETTYIKLSVRAPILRTELRISATVVSSC